MQSEGGGGLKKVESLLIFLGLIEKNGKIPEF